MDFKDVSSRFKKTREESPNEARVMDFDESYRIRAKMVGVLLRDARINAGRSYADCAAVLRVTPEQVEAWELGDDVPSLPQLEILAYYLGVPVSHFWGYNTMEAEREEHAHAAQAEYLALRDRMIGVLLRQARLELELSLDDLSAETGLPADLIERYELGEEPMPMHQLTVLANAVKKSIRYFLESSSHVGEFLALREDWKHFVDLPDDVRRFAANPLNVGFIEIAMMLAQMPTDRLRRVGESVLNITM